MTAPGLPTGPIPYALTDKGEAVAQPDIGPEPIGPEPGADWWLATYDGQPGPEPECEP
jgi:hypothetical protein